MMGLTGSLAANKFGEVNALVDRYNRDAASAPPGLDSLGRVFPKMTPVGPNTLKQVEHWKEALKKQFALEQQKGDLDRRREDLNRRRDELAEQWKRLQADGKPLDPADPRVVRLRQHLDRYKSDVAAYDTSLRSYDRDAAAVNHAITAMRGGGTAVPGDGGPYRLFTGAFSNTADLNGGGAGQEVATLAEARSRAARHMRESAGSQPSYRIVDRAGKVVEARGLFRNIQGKQDANAAPSRAPATVAQKCYICWIGDFASYGGATREEALANGRRVKQLNPTRRVRVTEHHASPSMTIDAISRTPGTTILDLR